MSGGVEAVAGGDWAESNETAVLGREDAVFGGDPWLAPIISA